MLFLTEARLVKVSYQEHLHCLKITSVQRYFFFLSSRWQPNSMGFNLLFWLVKIIAQTQTNVCFPLFAHLSITTTSNCVKYTSPRETQQAAFKCLQWNRVPTANHVQQFTFDQAVMENLISSLYTHFQALYPWTSFEVE